jgi:hypothetical protein
MAIVAVVAATLGGFVEHRRLTRIAAEYRAKAEDHAVVEKTLRMIVEQTGPNSPIDISPGEEYEQQMKLGSQKMVDEVLVKLAGQQPAHQ